MTIGIMQPYFFPYIGYFQLIKAVDIFIIYDDVDYIKQGWIARNRIILNKKEYMLILQLTGASSFKHINQVEVGNNKNKILRTIMQAYSKAPYFIVVFPLIQEILCCSDKVLSIFLLNQLKSICGYLKITTEILLSSSFDKNCSLHGQDKIINICKHMKADTYINSVGGQSLYSKEAFKEEGIFLMFLKSRDICYKQFDIAHIPWLSIIDIMMFNSSDRIHQFLTCFDLV